MWKECAIAKDDAALFGELIPDYCKKELESGDLNGVVFLNQYNAENPVIGLILYRGRAGMLEIEWVAQTAAYDTPAYGMEMVYLFTSRARMEGGFRGVYARFREGDRMAAFFREEDFELKKESSGVYRFRLSDAKAITKQEKNAKLDCCVSMKNADHAIQNEFLSSVDAHDAPVPISRPVRWDLYDPEISAFYRENGSVTGGILVEKEQEDLVIRLLYGQNPVAGISLLGYAFRSAIKKYGEEQTVVCPVLNESSESLVQKIVSSAAAEEVIRAEKIFAPGTGLPQDLITYGVSTDTAEEPAEDGDGEQEKE